MCIPALLLGLGMYNAVELSTYAEREQNSRSKFSVERASGQHNSNTSCAKQEDGGTVEQLSYRCSKDSPHTTRMRRMCSYSVNIESSPLLDTRQNDGGERRILVLTNYAKKGRRPGRGVLVCWRKIVGRC